MSKVLLGLILALAPMALGASACASAAGAAADGGHLASGKRLAQRDCGGCHAVTLRDKSANADAPPFRLLSQRPYDVDHLAAALRGGMMVGHPRMPLISLGEDEIADLAAYVKSIQASAT